jgi:hypothetical protein
VVAAMMPALVGQQKGDATNGGDHLRFLSGDGWRMPDRRGGSRYPGLGMINPARCRVRQIVAGDTVSRCRASCQAIPHSHHLRIDGSSPSTTDRPLPQRQTYYGPRTTPSFRCCCVTSQSVLR